MSADTRAAAGPGRAADPRRALATGRVRRRRRGGRDVLGGDAPRADCGVTWPERNPQDRAEAAQHDQLVAGAGGGGITVTDSLPDGDPARLAEPGGPRRWQDLHPGDPRGLALVGARTSPVRELSAPVHYCAAPARATAHTVRTFGPPPQAGTAPGARTRTRQAPSPLPDDPAGDVPPDLRAADW